MKIQTICASLCLMCMACNGNSTASKEASENSETTQTTETVSLTFDPNAGEECSFKFGDITFTRSVNGAQDLVSVMEEDGKLEFRSGAKTDYFCDPNEDGTTLNSPILLTEIDNTKPFNLTAKVTPEFTANGTYNAGVLFLWANDRLWQKFCFEQDERGNHRMVTVRTIGSSDDNNHEVVEQQWAYMRIYSNTKIIGFYYSLDGKLWQMLRIYKNDYPKRLYVGISNQCPKEDGGRSFFEELTLTSEPLSDLRLGN